MAPENEPFSAIACILPPSHATWSLLRLFHFDFLSTGPGPIGGASLFTCLIYLGVMNILIHGSYGALYVWHCIAVYTSVVVEDGSEPRIGTRPGAS